MPITYFIPLTKADETSHEVWGIAAVEEPDVHREILDYAKSKPNFQAWSDRMNQMTGGKSLGNVRAMHKGALAAVGKVIHFEALDDKKAFFVGAKIVDEEAWRKVQEGVYTGFSVGGRYGQRWPDEMLKGYTRYEALPSEISLVDTPAAPSARYELVKMDGAIETREFSELAKGESLDALVNNVRVAWYDRFSAGDSMMMDCCVIEVQNDQVIVEKGMDGLFAYPYTIDDAGKVTFGDPSPVEKQYVLKKGMNMKLEEIISQMESSDNQDVKALAAQLKAAMVPAGDADNGDAPKGEAPAQEQPPVQGQAKGENETEAPNGGGMPEAGESPEGQGLSADAVKEIVINLLVELGLVQKEGEFAKSAGNARFAEIDEKVGAALKALEPLDDLQKSYSALQVKQGQILSDIAKAVDGAEQLHSRLEVLEKRGASGPVLREVPMLPAEQQTLETLKRMASEATNPGVRQHLQAEIARLGIKAVQNNPIA